MSLLVESEGTGGGGGGGGGGAPEEFANAGTFGQERGATALSRNPGAGGGGGGGGGDDEEAP